jgi:hypothetical protein
MGMYGDELRRKKWTRGCAPGSEFFLRKTWEAEGVVCVFLQIVHNSLRSLWIYIGSDMSLHSFRKWVGFHPIHSLSRYITFVVFLDIIYISICIKKRMYLDNL